MDPISASYSAGVKTYIITLKFPSLEQAVDSLEEISYGGDCWEFRVDLLREDTSLPDELPSSDYVRKQLRVLQKLPRRLPILFTVRTVSQGGKFPDDAGDEALALMKLAAESGCEYIDVEMSWPSFVISGILAVKAQAKIVASFHEFDSSVKWTSESVQEMCSSALSVGDIVKLCIQSVDINDALELGLFVRDYQMKTQKPIIAVAMGVNGQLSRFTAPITFVTHKLIPAPPGSDQLCLSDIHQALHLLGQLPSRRFYLGGYENSVTSVLQPFLDTAFSELGFPYRTSLCGNELEAVTLERPDFGGAYVPKLNDTALSEFLRAKTEASQRIGSADLVLIKATTDGKRTLSADNITWKAILSCLDDGSQQEIISQQSTAVAFGVSVDTKAAFFALEHFGIENAIIVDCNKEAVGQLITHFPRLRIQHFDQLDGAVASITTGSSLAVFCVENLMPPNMMSLLKPYSGILIDLGESLKQRTQGQYADWGDYLTFHTFQKKASILYSLWTGRDALPLTGDR